MLKQFYLQFESNPIESFKIKHVQYNVAKKLHSLKYIKYNRIDILLVVDTEIEIISETSKVSRLKVGYEKELIHNLTSQKSIKWIYQSVIYALKLLWQINNWDVNDLERLRTEFESEKYSSFGVYGKVMISPDKYRKAEFYLEMFPEFANYYIRFSKKADVQVISFLKGFTDPSIFFGFFKNYYWRDNDTFFLKDINDEIFYIFNVKEESYAIEYKPCINSLEQLHGYVQAFQFDTPIKEMFRLLGIPNS